MSGGVLVYNPRAGRVLRRPGLVEGIEAALRPAFGDVRPVPTTGPNTAGAIAKREIAAGAETVFVCGGDGTVNEVAQALEGSGVPLGVPPGGTACGQANEPGLGNDPGPAGADPATATPRHVGAGGRAEVAGAVRPLGPLVAMAGNDRHQLPAARPDRDDQPAAVAQLLAQLVGDGRRGGRDDDPVPRRPGWVAHAAVGLADRHARVTGGQPNDQTAHRGIIINDQDLHELLGVEGQVVDIVEEPGSADTHTEVDP